LHARIKALEAKLKRMIAEGTNNPVAIELDDDAIELLGNFERQLESHIKLGGDLSDIDDFASKASQNACRLAVVFYVLTEQTGKLNYDMLIRAITIVIWHLKQAKNLFGTPPPVPQAIYDAEDLDRYLTRTYWSKNWHTVQRKAVRKNVAPIHLRDDDRLDAALAVLVSQKSIRLHPGPRRKCVIERRKGFN